MTALVSALNGIATILQQLVPKPQPPAPSAHMPPANVSAPADDTEASEFTCNHVHECYCPREYPAAHSPPPAGATTAPCSPGHCPASPYCMSPSHRPTSPSYCPTSPKAYRTFSESSPSSPRPAAAAAASEPQDDDYECPGYDTKNTTVRVHAELAFCVRYAKEHPEMLTRNAMTSEMYDDFEYHGVSDEVSPEEPDEHAAATVWTCLVQEYTTAGCGSDMLDEILKHIAEATRTPVPDDDAPECWLETADVKWFIDEYTAIMMAKRREDEEE